jgi:hypothetical protein
VNIHGGFMKRFIVLLITFFLIVPVFISAQEGKKNDALNSKLIDDNGKALDKQILELYQMIEKVVASSNIMSYEGVKYLPYQTDIAYGPDRDKPQYVELVKHIYIKEGLFGGKMVGYEEKTLRLYSDGKTINKMETIIRVRNFRTQSEEILSVVDPSPNSESKDNITITHTRNGKKIVEDKKLGEILNNIDLPIGNEIKAEFLIPNLVTLHKNLLFITEANTKSSKDVDMNVADFLKKSTYY